MSIDDESLAQSLDRLASEAKAPPHALELVSVRATRHRRLRNISISSLVVAAIIGTSYGVTHIATNELHETRSPSAAAVSETAPTIPTIPIEDLTGKDVGLALGLKPMTFQEFNAIGGCHAFAEYDEGVGFCIDSLANPTVPAEQDVESLLILRKINGLKRTPELVELATIEARLHTMEANDQIQTQAYSDLFQRFTQLNQEMDYPN